MTTRGVLLDIDGTLIDSTYLHTLAWGGPCAAWAKRFRVRSCTA